RFPAAKRVTRRQIEANYRLVLEHDRVGRLVDFQEFEGLTLPRARFAPELLAELAAEAGHQLREQGDEMVVHHLYVGRRVVPLDLFIASNRPLAEKEAAVSEPGWWQQMQARNASGELVDVFPYPEARRLRRSERGAT